jgi:hypothetical protein
MFLAASTADAAVAEPIIIIETNEPQTVASPTH